MFPFSSLLYAQKNVTNYILSIIVQNNDVEISGLGFHVYCADAQGNPLTEDVFPVSDTDIVLKNNNGLFRNDLSSPLLIETRFNCPIQFPHIFQGVHVVIEDSEENDGWIFPKQRISFLEFYKDSAQFRLVPLKGKHNYRESIITIQPIKENTFIQEFDEIPLKMKETLSKTKKYFMVFGDLIKNERVFHELLADWNLVEQFNNNAF
jgi:hypothetical protein